MPDTRLKTALAAPLRVASPDGDLVDRIGEYLFEEFPALDRGRLEEALQAVRDEFAGERVYIAGRSPAQRRELTQQILSLFNGRNTREVARRLGVSKGTVCRKVKQAGMEKRAAANSFTFAELGTPAPVRSRRTSAAAPGVPVVASAPAGTAGEPTASAPWPSLKQTSTL